MSRLRIGHDYHLAEVKHTPRDPFLRGWYAYCDACGWQGPGRGTKGDAEDDAAAHDNAENE